MAKLKEATVSRAGEGPQAGKVQGRVIPASTQHHLQSAFLEEGEEREGTEVIRPRIRMSIGGVSSANSGASFPREDRGPSCRRVDGWMP